ncbi:inosine/xanthosine triphosphatase [Halobacterium yunchengense]|uniref:inosine/xanthosine triphosphatase n=1 Tax=Halobacterium yunchengense TaxID=3108497 RepID=UPI00300A71B9
MRVAVGSGNPVKRDAVAAALPDATVEPVPVESGVPEQPWGDDETVEGARNRAERALAAGAYDLGVGLEGGVAPGPTGLFLVMWAAATDGDRWEVGAGPRMRLPDRVADRLRDGAELGPVMDDLLDTSGVAENRGAAGVLTGGVTDRTEALRTAVAGALGPFLTDYY